MSTRSQLAQRQVELAASEAKRRAKTRYNEDRVGPELMARLAEIPADTRGLTARMFGDPLPGRSALDRRSIGGR